MIYFTFTVCPPCRILHLKMRWEVERCSQKQTVWKIRQYVLVYSIKNNTFTLPKKFDILFPRLREIFKLCSQKNTVYDVRMFCYTVLEVEVRVCRKRKVHPCIRTKVPQVSSALTRWAWHPSRHFFKQCSQKNTVYKKFRIKYNQEKVEARTQ